MSAGDALALVGIDSFESPRALLPLLALAALALLAARRARPAVLPWPALAEARVAGARARDPLRPAALALRAGALGALAAALAGPVGVWRAAPEPGEGLDLVLAVDASGSMRALDTELAGERSSRLALAREVVARFARQRAAAGDRVALVAFGESAFTACPLTGDGRLLAAALARLEPGVAGEATALGDALALAVKRAAAGRAAAPADGPPPGRAVVLLTDGRDNAGRVPLEVATALARGEGVRVHTVAIGAADGPVAMAREGGGALRFERHDVDAAALERIAAATGGRFYAARRARDLDAVYGAIDALERPPRRLPPRAERRERREPLLALAGGLLLAEIAIARIWRRRLP